jgi:uncharacterized membrane protein required for colicin V production
MLNTIINIMPTVFVGIVVLLGIIGALKGFSRGISRQVIRTLTVVVSGIISFILVKLSYTKISERLDGKTVADVERFLMSKGILSETQNLGLLREFDVDTLEVIFATPMSLIIMPVLFVICFMTVSSAMLIVHGILSALFGFKKHRNNFLTRLLGMGLGLMQGVAVAGLILMPIIGIGSSVSDSVAQINEESPESESAAMLSEKYYSYLAPTVEGPIFTLYEKYGIKVLYTKIATIDIGETPTDMTLLIPDAAKIACELKELKGADFKNLTHENEASIDRIFDTVGDNGYLTEVLAALVNDVSHAYTKGTFNIEVGDPFKSVIDSAASIFHTADRTNVNTDIDTVKNVLFILSRDGVLNAFDAGSDAMLDVLTKRDTSGETTVNRIVDTINSNERTKPLVTLITKLSVTVMSQKAGISEDALMTYDNIKAGINENILSINKEDFATEEEYVAEVSLALDNTLKENNITLEKEIVDTMAQYVTDNYGDIDEITDDEANDIILSYYDAYLDYLETGSVPDAITPPVLE